MEREKEEKEQTAVWEGVPYDCPRLGMRGSVLTNCGSDWGTRETMSGQKWDTNWETANQFQSVPAMACLGLSPHLSHRYESVGHSPPNAPSALGKKTAMLLKVSCLYCVHLSLLLIPLSTTLLPQRNSLNIDRK